MTSNDRAQFEVIGGYLTAAVEGCTCDGPFDGVPGVDHRGGCGYEPVATVDEIVQALRRAGSAVPAPSLDWAVVEAAVRQAVIDWALAYWIPANGLCSGVRAHQQKMASNWADGSAPFIAARIREDLRKAASGSPEGGGTCE